MAEKEESSSFLRAGDAYKKSKKKKRDLDPLGEGSLAAIPKTTSPTKNFTQLPIIADFLRFDSRVWKEERTFLLFFAFLFVFLIPDIASAGPFENALTWTLNLLTGAAARIGAGIAFAVLGIMAWAGRMEMRRAGGLILGLALIFGGSTIVDTIITAIG